MSADNAPQGVRLEFNEYIVTQGRIRSFADIPDVITMAIRPPSIWCQHSESHATRLRFGPDQTEDGKTFLGQMMALAVSRGETFLGMHCIPSPVLYLDLENPGYVVQERMQALVADGERPADLRFWGTWLEIDQQPPQAGSELLLTICKRTGHCSSWTVSIFPPGGGKRLDRHVRSDAVSPGLCSLRLCGGNPASSRQGRGQHRQRFVGDPWGLRSSIPAHPGQGKRADHPQGGQEPPGRESNHHDQG